MLVLVLVQNSQKCAFCSSSIAVQCVALSLCCTQVEATAHFYYLKSTPVKCRHLLLLWMHCTPVLASDAL